MLPDDDPDADPGDDELAGDDEQDLLVVLRLGNRQMGTRHEREAIAQLADELHAAVQAARVGECDGDEYGGGTCTLFFCGPDADKLLAVLRPLLARSPLARGGHFVRMVEGADGSFAPEQLPL